MEKRYPMCKDQPAQIDCRRNNCLFHKNGICKNVSPAITLNDDGTAKCWSFEEIIGYLFGYPVVCPDGMVFPEGEIKMGDFSWYIEAELKKSEDVR